MRKTFTALFLALLMALATLVFALAEVVARTADSITLQRVLHMRLLIFQMPHAVFALKALGM